MRTGEGKRGRSQLHHREIEVENRIKRSRGNHKDTNVGKEMVVYRILCPDSVIGSVIGKSGKVLNKIREDTDAHIKLVDPLPGAKYGVLTVHCQLRSKRYVDIDEEFNFVRPLCTAQDALVKVHAVIADAVIKHKRSDKEECRILVPSSQAEMIIGKSSSTIQGLRSKSRAHIEVMEKDCSNPAHACAFEFENFIQITGNSEAVKRALLAVSTIMFKFPPNKAVLLAYVPKAPPIIIPSEDPVSHASGLYPTIKHDADIRGTTSSPPLSGFADAGNSWPVYPGASKYEELTLRVLCPSCKIGRVIGKGGSTIKRLTKISGARITIYNANGGGDDDDRIIVVTSIESPDDDMQCSMSIKAVLLLQEKINDKADETVTIRLLVPAKSIGAIVGRSGSIVKEIRYMTKAEIHISKGKNPNSASHRDELVEVVGSVEIVRNALTEIILRLRDNVLKEKESPRDSLSIPARDSESGSFASYSSEPHRGPPSPLTIEMYIPDYAYYSVSGEDGANLANIKNISGAFVQMTNDDTRGDFMALISGTYKQVRHAEDMIQHLIRATNI